MSDDTHSKDRPLGRFSSGIGGLDRILAGGFLEGGVYLFLAPPGGGKTILAHQIAFHHAKAGQRVLYVTLLAESHARMFQHLSEFPFFDRRLVGRSVVY